MARLRQQKSQLSVQSTTSHPSIARRRGVERLDICGAYGRGRNGKNLKLLHPELLPSNAVPREHDEDSGLGTEASPENDCSANCIINCSVACQAAPKASSISNTVHSKSSSELFGGLHHVVLTPSSGSAVAGNTTTSFQNLLSSPATIFVVTAPTNSKLATTPSSRCGTRTVVTSPNNKSLSCSLINGTTPVRLARPGGGSHYKSMKRRLNVFPARQGESTSSVVPVAPLTGDGDAQRPPAKKQATVKRKQALSVKRLKQPPLVRGSLLLQLSDEVTQELPGECPPPLDGIRDRTSHFRPVPQLLDFRNISTASAQGFPSPRSRSSTAGEMMPIIKFGTLQTHLNLTEESLTSPKHFSSMGLRRGFVPLLHKELGNIDDASVDSTGSSVIISTSPLSRKNHSSSSKCFTSSGGISSALLSSDLTNLCGDLSLSQSSSNMPTSFLSCKPLLISPEPEVSSSNGQSCLSEEFSSKSHVDNSLSTDPMLNANKSTPQPSLPDAQSSLVMTTSTAVSNSPHKDQSVTKDETFPSTNDDGDNVCNAGSVKEFALLSAQLSSVGLSVDLRNVSSDGRIRLVFVKQPERQHRARYLTEGSRGAVKDQEASGHPVIKVVGTNRACVMQVFVGSDSGRVGPHVYYQACQVVSKTISEISEKKIMGTTVIEVPVTPSMDMTLCCDCVGILKERYVDVEQRRGGQRAPVKSRKTTKCRLVFRAVVQMADGSTQILQIASQPISCTQPPGVPEIVRKSVSRCSATDQPEMFIIGKHFQKDSKVLFQLREKDSTRPEEEEQVLWSKTVRPDPDVLQATHLVCTVPKFDHIALPSGRSVEVSVQVLSAGRQSESQPLFYHGDDPAPEGPSPTKATPVLQFTSLSDAARINQEFAATGKFHQLPSKSTSLIQDEKEPSARSSLHEKLDQMTDDQLVELNRVIRALTTSSIDASHGAALQVIKDNDSSNELGTGLEKSSVPLDASSISDQERTTVNMSRDSFMVCEHPVSHVPCPSTETRTVTLGKQATFADVPCIKEDLQFSALYSNASCNTTNLPQATQSSLPCGSKDLDICYTQLNNVVFVAPNNQVNQGFNAIQPSSSESTSSSGSLLGKHIKTTHLNNIAAHLSQVDDLASKESSFMQPQSDVHHHKTYSDVKQELKFTNNSEINKLVLGIESSVKLEHAEDRTHKEFPTSLDNVYSTTEASIVESQLVTSPSGTLKSSASSSELNLGVCAFDSQSMLNSTTTAAQEQYTLAAGTFINTNVDSQIAAESSACTSTCGISSSLLPASSNTVQRTFVTTPEAFKMDNPSNSLSNTTSSFSEALDNTSNINGKNTHEQSTLDSSTNFTDLQQYLGPNINSIGNLGSSTTCLNEIVLTNQAQHFPANANPLTASAVMSYANENLPSHAMSTATSYPTNQMSSQHSQSNAFMNCFSTNNSVSSNTYVQNEEMGTPCYVSTSAEFINDSYRSSQQTQNKFHCTSQNHPISQELSEIGQALQSVGQHANLEEKNAAQQNVFGNQTANSAMAIHHLSTDQMQVQPIANHVQMLTKMNQVPSKIFGVCESMQQVHEEMSHLCQVEAKGLYRPSNLANQHTSLLPSDNLRHHSQSHQKISFQAQHSQEGVNLVSQQQSVVAPGELKIHQNVPQSNCSTQSVPGLATMDAQPDAVRRMQQLQHQGLSQIQQSAITSDSLTLGDSTELQPQPAQGQQNAQSYDGLKPSVLVGDHDPLLSQVNTNLSSWSASAFDQTGANSQPNQINPDAVIPMQSSYIFMPNGNYQIENNV